MLAFCISATRCNLDSSSREMQYEPGAAIKSTAIKHAFSYRTIIVADQTSNWQIFNRWIIKLSSAVISYTTRNVVSSTTAEVEAAATAASVFRQTFVLLDWYAIIHFHSEGTNIESRRRNEETVFAHFVYISRKWYCTYVCLMYSYSSTIFIAHPRSGFFYTPANLKFSNSAGNRSRDKNRSLLERSEPLQNTSGAYFNYF